MATILVGGACALRGKEEQCLIVGDRGPPGQGEDTGLENAQGQSLGPTPETAGWTLRGGF